MQGIFRSEDHKQRFEAAMTWLGKIYDGKFDAEYSAAVYILTAEEYTWQLAQTYASNHGIDFDSFLEKEVFSSGEMILTKLAGNLFNGNQDINPVELMRLDNNNFKLALSAMLVRRFGVRVEDSRKMEVRIP